MGLCAGVWAKVGPVPEEVVLDEECGGGRGRAEGAGADVSEAVGQNWEWSGNLVGAPGGLAGEGVPAAGLTVADRARADGLFLPSGDSDGVALMLPAPPRGEATPTGPILFTRKSLRLAGLPSDDALEKAVRRKALSRELAVPSEPCGSSAKPPRQGSASVGDDAHRRTPGPRKTKRLGRKCGILLSDDEVRSFREFVEVAK